MPIDQNNKPIDPFKPLKRREINPDNDSLDSYGNLGRYKEVVRSYASEPRELISVDLSQYGEIVESICPRGQPAIELYGRKLSWKRGLVSLCDFKGSGEIAKIASAHEIALTELYLIVRKSEDDGSIKAMYDDNHSSSSAEQRGAYTAKDIPIGNRECLSDEYISRVLKPYENAKLECRNIFRRDLEVSHRDGNWLCLVPLDNSNYISIPPGLGFDESNSYEVNRSTYLKGFELNEDEVEENYYPDSEAFLNQDQWLFLDADQLREIEGNSPSIDGVANKPFTNEKQKSKDKGTRGYQVADVPFVMEGVNIFKLGFAKSANEAATSVVTKYGDQIKGTSFDTKVDRLRKPISTILKL